MKGQTSIKKTRKIPAVSPAIKSFLVHASNEVRNSSTRPKHERDDLVTPLNETEKSFAFGEVIPLEEVIDCTRFAPTGKNYLLECGHRVSEHHLKKSVDKLLSSKEDSNDSVTCELCTEPLLLENFTDMYYSPADHLKMRIYMVFPGHTKLTCKRNGNDYLYKAGDKQISSPIPMSKQCKRITVEEEQVEIKEPQVLHNKNPYSQVPVKSSAIDLLCQATEDPDWEHILSDPTDSLNEAIRTFGSKKMTRTPLFENGQLTKYVYKTVTN